MPECHNNVEGLCTIATYLTQHTVNIEAKEDACTACCEMEKPKTVNKVTCGMAVLGLHKQKTFRMEQHAHLVECGAFIVNPSNETNNRPGTALRKILHSVGIKEPVNCTCEEYATAMDSWGWKLCTTRRQTIIDHLNSQQVSWFDMVKIAAAGYLTTGSLVDSALSMSNPNKP